MKDYFVYFKIYTRDAEFPLTNNSDEALTLHTKGTILQNFVRQKLTPESGKANLRQ